jgi:hypothetical protein
MTRRNHSLLAGRNTAPLTPEQVRRVTNAFLGLDPKVNTRFDRDATTAFRVGRDESGSEVGEIVFGPDTYPGTNLVNPNSALNLLPTVAHELTHYHRWANLQALSEGDLEHLDEALTSLQAISRYYEHLSDIDVQQLVSEAMQRITLFIEEALPGIRQGGIG